jgi:hypothetical protein
MNILSIDVGIINLGYVYSVVDTLTGSITVIDCNKVDITIMRHCNIPFIECTLHHDNCFPDYLEHFFQEYKQMFINADIVLIERQPIVGITNVQDLILNKYRDKAILISPNTIHKHFYMSKNYNTRKKQSEKITNELLSTNQNYNMLLRKHDISDAMLLIIYYTQLNFKKKRKIDSIIDLEQFRFNAETKNT